MGTKVRVAVALAVAAVVGACGDARGQDQQDEWTYAPQVRYLQANLPVLEKAYVYCLESPIEGVVECAVREVARIKLAHLTWESDALKKRLEDIALNGMTPPIRYKASLVRAMFDAPALFAAESSVDFRTPTQLYLAVARRLESGMLAGK
jgi:hypothetical protein